MKRQNGTDTKENTIKRLAKNAKRTEKAEKTEKDRKRQKKQKVNQKTIFTFFVNILIMPVHHLRHYVHLQTHIHKSVYIIPLILASYIF